MSSEGLPDSYERDVEKEMMERDAHPVETAERAEANDLGGKEEQDDAAQQALSKKTTANSVNTIPDGGTRAWMQVVASFFLFFNSWGVVQTYGGYQTYYVTSLLQDQSPSTVAWIGSVQAFLLLFIGVLTGPIYDMGYMRSLIATGTFAIVFGHMMLSLCHTYWQVLLAQSFVIGLGPGLLFVPSVAILSTYFRRHLALSVGISATGSSVGSVVYPVMLRKLIPQVGFPWTVRIIGFMTLATLILPNLVLKVRVLPPAKRTLIDWESFKDWPFMVFNLGMFISFLGVYVPFYYIGSYSLEHRITDENLAFYLICILSAASTFGRVIPNFLADKVGPMNMFVPCTTVSGILILCFIPVRSTPSLIVVGALFGFCSGAFVSLPPSIIVGLTKDRSKMGARMGMAFALAGLGLLAGTPIAGAIETSRGFTSVWIWGGITMAGGGLLIGVARVMIVGWKLNVRA